MEGMERVEDAEKYGVREIRCGANGSWLVRFASPASFDVARLALIREVPLLQDLVKFYNALRQIVIQCIGLQ
jgi:hypothetical protein